MASRAKKGADNQIPVIVFNPSSWVRTDVVECQFSTPSAGPILPCMTAPVKRSRYEVLPGQAAAETRIAFLAVEVLR